ncbi:MAG TPA: hypothetical protein VLY03_12745 [Bacteroidota bacterium]|nr:hypothetical protein [Bacteroidota bacterium]
MNTRLIGSVLVIMTSIFLPAAGNAVAQDTLSTALNIDLQRIDETWNLLDQYANEIWPGWTGYADVPFLIDYPDGERMLIGHPNPPEGFKCLNNYQVHGKKVYLDSRNEIALALRLPLLGGGGPIPFGIFNGVPVRTIHIQLTSLEADSAMPGDSTSIDTGARRIQTASENQLLIYAHELYHCYQYKVYENRYGNLQYNTDENYATYAEIEGLALERAYTETDPRRMKEYLRDFIVARDLKRRSMDTTEQLQESEEELMEGMATYVEMKILDLVKVHHTPVARSSGDPYFFGFADVDSLLQAKLRKHEYSRAYTMDSRGKSYTFGALQGLLLDRITPGWKTDFYRNGIMPDRLVANALHISAADKSIIAEGLKTRYAYDSIHNKHAGLIRERDSALESIRGRKGLSFIIDLKRTNDFVTTHADGKFYSFGIMYIYPAGIKKMKIEDVELTGLNTPMVVDQLYYMKWVDTDPKPGEDNYELKYSRKEGENVYYDATLTAGGFILKAPKLEIARSHDRVKITILSKVHI